MWGELEVAAAERMALASGEIGEGHFKGAADLRIEVVHLAGESIRRQPFDHGVCIEERTIDALGRGAKNTVESDGMGIRCRHIAGSGSLAITTDEVIAGGH